MRRVLVPLLLLTACASGPRQSTDPDYLRYVSFEVPINRNVLLRWRKRDMPLKVHLPFPEAHHFSDPEGVYHVVRDGIVDWSDAAAPGIPSFEFVSDAAQADIPIVWEKERKGWFIAFCSYDRSVLREIFAVDRILVTAREVDGREASLEDIYITMLHEMGHALGLGGHSPDPRDVMFPYRNEWPSEPSPRDRATIHKLYKRPVGHPVVGAREFP